MNSLDSGLDYPGVAGKCYLVTGASSGIGKATAILLSRLGAQVIVTGRNEERLAETHAQMAGTKHVVVAADLCEVEMLSWLKGLIAKAEAPLAGVAHCAGIRTYDPLRGFKAEKFAQCLTDHTVLAANIFSAACRVKEKNCELSLVYMSTLAAHIASSTTAFYGAARSAMESICRSFAVEFSSKMVRCNSIAGGLMAGSSIADGFTDMLEGELYEKTNASYPLGIGSVGDAANAFAFLLGSASRWITGITLTLDGGYSISGR